MIQQHSSKEQPILHKLQPRVPKLEKAVVVWQEAAHYLGI